MAQPPIIEYDAKEISHGLDLKLTGQGTPNLTAEYGDYGGSGEAVSLKARCVISINYNNVSYSINNDNSVTVTGNIGGAQLVRTATGTASSNQQLITVRFNGEEVFNQTVNTASSGTYNLNIPSSFSVTIPASTNPQSAYPAAIQYYNHNTRTSNPADEFALGILITNPNPPDYRPGANRQSSWQSHNRSNGKANIRVNGSWIEMRTIEGTGNPPLIRENTAWRNQKKVGANG